MAVLLLANQKESDKANSASASELYPDVEYGGVFDLDIPTPIAEPPSRGEVPEWHGRRSHPGTGEKGDPRITSFQKAVGSGGLLLNRDQDPDEVVETDTNTPQRTAPGTRVLLDGSMIPAVLEARINSDRPGPSKGDAGCHGLPNPDQDSDPGRHPGTGCDE